MVTLRELTADPTLSIIALLQVYPMILTMAASAQDLDVRLIIQSSRCDRDFMVNREIDLGTAVPTLCFQIPEKDCLGNPRQAMPRLGRGQFKDRLGELPEQSVARLIYAN